MVQQKVVAGVLHAPLVDVVGKNTCRSAFDGHDGQDACARPGIDDVLSLEVEACQGAQDEPCGLVAACAESQSRRDEDVVLCRRHIGMLHVVNHDLIAYHYRLKAFLLPDLVPVFVGCFRA